MTENEKQQLRAIRKAINVLLSPETRECPKCKAEIAIDSLIDIMRKEYQPKIKCKCGALLFLDWERDETDDGPNDMYWLEEVIDKNENGDI